MQSRLSDGGRVSPDLSVKDKIIEAERQLKEVSTKQSTLHALAKSSSQISIEQKKIITQQPGSNSKKQNNVSEYLRI